VQDTFLDAEHLQASFPGYEVEFVNNSGGPEPVRPFKITFPLLSAADATDPTVRKRKASPASRPVTGEG
jgi:hypothetical protein